MATVKAQQITTTWVDGKMHVSIPTCEKIVFDPERASDTCRAYAQRYGWETRLTRAAAMSRDTATGQPASWADKRAAILTLADWYMQGGDEWAMKPGARVARITTDLIVEGIVRAGLAADVDAAHRKVRAIRVKRELADDDAAARVWYGTKEVHAAVQAILAERVATRVDADSLLEEIGEEDVVPGSVK